MSSKVPGNSISNVEVTHVSSHGIWVLADEKEYFLSYEEFPWFRDSPLKKILNVTELSPGHLYWRDLDVDLGLESMEYPQRFPLKYRQT